MDDGALDNYGSWHFSGIFLSLFGRSEGSSRVGAVRGMWRTTVLAANNRPSPLRTKFGWGTGEGEHQVLSGAGE